MQLTGAQIVIECLKEQGVDTVFGYPGGAILNVYDELYKHRHEIKHVLTSHEQGASHAADGYARSTGKVGVCLATSGIHRLVQGFFCNVLAAPFLRLNCNRVKFCLIGSDILWDIHQNRPRPAPAGNPKGPADGIGQFFYFLYNKVMLGNGRCDSRNVNFLKTVFSEQRNCNITGNGYHGNGIHIGCGNSGYQIGGSRP